MDGNGKDMDVILFQDLSAHEDRIYHLGIYICQEEDQWRLTLKLILNLVEATAAQMLHHPAV